MAEKTIKRTIYINEKPIDYIIKYKKVKNLNLRIKPDGTITLSANKNFSLERLDGFLIEKQDFIFKALKIFENYTPSIRKEVDLKENAQIMLLGEKYIVNLIQANKQGVEISGNTISISCKDIENSEKTKAIFNVWAKKYMLEFFIKETDLLYQKLQEYNIPKPEVKVRDMKSRWGSCHYTTKKLTLNLRLIYFSKECTEFVICHELCHLVHPNHSKEFHRLLSKIYPNWKEVNKELH